MDEMWSVVPSKRPQRWLNHDSGEILADVLVSYEDTALSTLMELLTPFGIQPVYTDNWGAYSRQLDPQQHRVGKTNPQTIERKHLMLRTRIKRLARKTIGFSKSVLRHDTVIGLFINRYEFGRAI